ncbi:MAG: DUF1573 domain-containing protein [Saprospiraceae bacterium]|jgi:hypothetical protein|nr:DUF1573 domain-containing protein [Saprospiraceae bacterium]
MKQLFFIFSFLAFGTMAAIAQHTYGPVMTFEKTTHDFGTIDKNANGLHKFKFTNSGNEPLIIKSGKAGSGVKVAYPNEPIMPGESSVIEATYDTNRVGPFSKWISLTTNEIPDTHSLTVKGEVKAPPTQESVPTPLGGLNGGN